MTYAWQDLGDGRQVYRKVDEAPRGPRSDHLAAPMVIGDTMPHTEHPCDGKFYDSKARFRAVTKANGCIEVGNDPARFRRKPKAKPDRKGIHEAVRKAANRIKNG